MNYYNPYMFTFPSAASASNGILGKLTFSSFINGTSKALNLINQAIPVFKQASPMFRNVKTMFKVMNEFKKTNTINETSKTNIEKNIINNDGKPTFFI